MPFHSTSSLSACSRPSFMERFRYNIDMYKNIAAKVRSSLHLTFHARRRAAILGLRVDTQKAVLCDHRQVSNVPLPIIDTEPSPVQLQWVHEDIQSVLQQTPQSVSSASSDEYEDEYVHIEPDVEERVRAAAEIHRPIHRPALRSAQTSTEKANLQSKFSPDSEYSANAFTSSMPCSMGADGHHQDPHQPAEQYSHPSSRVRTGFIADEQQEECAISKPAPRRLVQSLQVPTDANRLSRGCGEMSEMDGISSPVFTEYFGSDSSASGLTTPEDAGPMGHRSPLMIRIKRSDPSIIVGKADSPNEPTGHPDFALEVEKRPKFERKEWVHPYARRSLNLRISPSRRRSRS